MLAPRARRQSASLARQQLAAVRGSRSGEGAAFASLFKQSVPHSKLPAHEHVDRQQLPVACLLRMLVLYSKRLSFCRARAGSLLEAVQVVSHWSPAAVQLLRLFGCPRCLALFQPLSCTSEMVCSKRTAPPLAAISSQSSSHWFAKTLDDEVAHVLTKRCTLCDSVVMNGCMHLTFNPSKL